MILNTKRDGHVHSTYCPHGSNDTLDMYIDTALKNGITEITFTAVSYTHLKSSFLLGKFFIISLNSGSPSPYLMISPSQYSKSNGLSERCSAIDLTILLLISIKKITSFNIYIFIIPHIC